MMKGSSVERTNFLLLQILNLSCHFALFFLLRVPLSIKIPPVLVGMVDKTPPTDQPSPFTPFLAAPEDDLSHIMGFVELKFIAIIQILSIFLLEDNMISVNATLVDSSKG